MLDYLEFISKEKSMLIAPAGFGKTHAIAECLKYTRDQGKQLILTHTHAGVGSIKEKIKKEGIPNSSYHVETITSFAQKYVLSFYTGTDIPAQEDSKNYYPFILEKAIELFKLKPIRRIVLVSYKGLFVDEYQDCTIEQHALIKSISKLFPTRVLGDYLQGIFGFKGETLVNMNDPNQFSEYTTFKLETPWRWIKGENENLGQNLVSIRDLLEKNEPIDLVNFKSVIEIHKMKKSNEFLEFEIKDASGNKIKNPLNKVIWALKKESSLLIIYPNDDKNKNSAPRELFIKRFGDDFKLLEAIDDKDFYKLSVTFDNTTPQKIEADIMKLLYKCFTKKSIGYWFISSLNNSTELMIFKPVISNIKKLKVEINKGLIGETLSLISSLPNMKCFRKDLFRSISSALSEAETNKITVHEAMINKRNSVRRIGRKVIGKCVGTTLLTKGLEFDTVAIVNAHDFDCPKHLYVAVTRASKRLIIFTADTILKPYKTNTMKTTRDGKNVSELLL